MSEITEERRIVEDLGVIMMGKLRANGHKTGWVESSQANGPDYSMWIRRLKEETAELEEELAKPEIRAGKVRGECADVANIVAMISDLALMFDRSKK